MISESSAWIYKISDFNSKDFLISIAVGIPNAIYPQQRHTGILYKDSSGNSLLLHLAQHEELLTQNISEYPEFYCVEIKLEKERIENINANCKVISRTKDLIPYGLYFDGDVEFIDGKLESFGKNNGLTCATFVLAVFKNNGINILDLNSWKNISEKREEEDKKFHDQIIKGLENEKKRKGRPNQEYIDKIKREIGCSRFRPEEVAGAASIFENAPISYDIAVKKGLDVLSVLLNN